MQIDELFGETTFLNLCIFSFAANNNCTLLEEKDPVVLGEISELDETYVLESSKGKKLVGGAREPRKRLLFRYQS